MQTFTKQDVAKLAGVVPSTLLRHLDQGVIPEPSVVVGRRRLYTPEEALVVVSHFSQHERYTQINKDKEGN